MSISNSNLAECERIAAVIQHYIDGAKSGRANDMKAAFRKDASTSSNRLLSRVSRLMAERAID